jgi:hypothetical protein
MKTIRSRTGPFVERPHFQLREIEEICIGELRRMDIYPSTPEAIRIDRFVEKRFSIAPRYEVLPAGVLGFTQFGRKGVEAIVISRTLDEGKSKVDERRLRSTLAHEAGHGLLHAYLFQLGEKPKSLFDDHDHTPRILCREMIEGPRQRPGYDGHWSEFQANRAIGGLLMPRPLVEQALREFCVEAGRLGQRTLAEERREENLVASSLCSRQASFLGREHGQNPVCAPVARGLAKQARAACGRARAMCWRPPWHAAPPLLPKLEAERALRPTWRVGIRSVRAQKSKLGSEL